jgi:rhamnosyltransferase
LLLDQDSVLKKDFVKNLLKARKQLASNNINVGALGPVYYNEVTNETYPITKFWGPFIKRFAPTIEPAEASFLIASGCLIDVKVLKDVGLMNEDLFIDFIDVDWSFRAQVKKYKLFVVPDAVMMHTIGESRMNVGGRSIAVHSPLRRYYLFRNSVFMVKNKNMPWGYKLREIVFNTFRIIVYVSMSNDRVRYLKYSLSGLKDGINNIGGECTHKY